MTPCRTGQVPKWFNRVSFLRLACRLSGYTLFTIALTIELHVQDQISISPSGFTSVLLGTLVSAARLSGFTLYTGLPPQFTPYTTRLTPGIVSWSKCHWRTVYEHLVLSIILPCPAYNVGRIAAAERVNEFETSGARV
jgi:hypothetical protein